MVFEHAPKFRPDEKPTHHDAGTVGPYDALQHYRDFRPSAEVAHLGPVADSQGHITFPSIYNPLKHTVASHPANEAASPGHTASAHRGVAGEHTVKSGESLWKIAQESLSHSGDKQHPTGSQIWQRVNSIVEANHHKHPGLASNPSLIHEGDQLIVPAIEGRQAGHGPVKKHPGQAPEGRGATRPETPASPKESASEPEIGDGGRLARFVGGLTQDIAHGLASALGFEATKAAKHLHSVFDCAHGPRLALEHFGIKLNAMPATSQGRILEQSGLFDRVTNPQPGDYGYRHWTNHTIQMQEQRKHRHLGDLGDSFIVTGGSRDRLQAANDHFFQVPPAGGYYKPGITFLRPNANFYKAYEHYKATGQMTHL